MLANLPRDLLLERMYNFHLINQKVKVSSGCTCRLLDPTSLQQTQTDDKKIIFDPSLLFSESGA